jgi:GNAT superfamily N-acetyltransferase
MKLRYEKISENNIRVASKIQYEIFPNSSAYLKYLKEIQNKTLDLPVDFLIFENDIPIGVVGLYEISKYKDTIWLSWFGVVEDYRYKGYGSQIFEDIINEAKKIQQRFLKIIYL